MAKPSSIEKVTEVIHYTASLFSFKITRPDSLRFKPGQFIMLGLEIDNKPVMRAYSIASGPYDEELEFYSIKIPEGTLTSKLQHIKVGDDILLSKKAVGNLTPWDVKVGKRLFLMATGTGIAPFASILRDPETYDLFDNIVLTHTCRYVNDLLYGKDLINKIKNSDLYSPEAAHKLIYYPTVTRESVQDELIKYGRITDLLESGRLFKDLGAASLDPEFDRVMLCGSNDMLKDIGKILELNNMYSSSGGTLREYAYERAFVG